MHFPRIHLAIAGLLALAPVAAPQSQPYPGVGGYSGPVSLHFAWVDPVQGEDTANPAQQINDSDKPFKTLQAAIDQMNQFLHDNHPSQPPQAPECEYPVRVEGLIYALPGLYGPHGSGSSGDALPIKLRDRVHVRGLGARGVVLRGVGMANTFHMFWPTEQPATANSYVDAEVLLDLSDVHGCVPTVDGDQPAWCVIPPGSCDMQDTVEHFDGFTFQGGNVQARVGPSSDGNTQKVGQQAVISNCVFDMRHNWIDEVSGNPVSGPTVGVMMSKLFIGSGVNQTYGYLDQKILIANNTFIMAQRGVNQVGGNPTWIEECRPQAVGIMDVSDPGCGAFADCDDTVRGMGSPGIINNVFRTRELSGSPSTFPVAMLGVDASDTRMTPSGGGGPVLQTNVFASARAGHNGTNGLFHSNPVVPVIRFPADPMNLEDPFLHCQADAKAMGGTYDCDDPDPTCHTPACTAAQVPESLIEIYDGPVQAPELPGLDPGFIGEYLAMNYAGLEDYTDWRLLPGDGDTASPLKDAGWVPYDAPVVMENGTTFELHPRPEVSSFVWDGEGYGNPRIVDGDIDVGFDEVHLFSMAGSYGNASNSHNHVGTLNPTAPPGKPERYAFVRRSAGGITLAQGNQIKLHGTQEAPQYPPMGPLPAWTLPPGVLATPLENTGLPVDYRTKYISYNNQGNPNPPTPFTENLTTSSFVDGWMPLGLLSPFQQFDFILMTPPNSIGLKLDDDEGIEHAYFNTQALIFNAPAGTQLLRGNLQVEYR